jgi:hypothetical protein
MCSTVSPTTDRVRIEIRRGSEPAIGFDVALSEAGNLSSLAQASARAMGFSTFVAFNRLQRSPELWLTLALAGLRLALAFDHRAAAARDERLLQQAAADAAVARAARIAALDRCAPGWPRPGRDSRRPAWRPIAPSPFGAGRYAVFLTGLFRLGCGCTRGDQLDAVDRHCHRRGWIAVGAQPAPGDRDADRGVDGVPVRGAELGLHLVDMRPGRRRTPSGQIVHRGQQGRQELCGAERRCGHRRTIEPRPLPCPCPRRRGRRARPP